MNLNLSELKENLKKQIIKFYETDIYENFIQNKTC